PIPRPAQVPGEHVEALQRRRQGGTDGEAVDGLHRSPGWMRRRGTGPAALSLLAHALARADSVKDFGEAPVRRVGRRSGTRPERAALREARALRPPIGRRGLRGRKVGHLSVIATDIWPTRLSASS